MSWYNTVVISFNCAEYDDEDDESNHDSPALRRINAWLRGQKFASLSDLNSFDKGKLGSNVVLFGGCYNWLDADKFVAVVGRQRWKHPEDVRILVWDDNATTFSLIAPVPALATEKAGVPKRTARKRRTSGT